MSHVPRPTTRIAAPERQRDLRQRPVAASDRHQPSADRTRIALRPSPSPVGIATSTNSFASARSAPGRIPTVVPPASFAPRHAASIAPPSPPHTSTTPREPSSRPTASATSHSSGVASPGRLRRYTSGPRRRLRPDRRLLVRRRLRWTAGRDRRSAAARLHRDRDACVDSTAPASISADPPRPSHRPVPSSRSIPAGGWLMSWLSHDQQRRGAYHEAGAGADARVDEAERRRERARASRARARAAPGPTPRRT